MSLSKLTQAAAGAVKEITSKKAANTSAKVAQQTKTVAKNAKGALDALAAQGKAMVKKFDVTSMKKAPLTTSNVAWAPSQVDVDEAIQIAEKKLINKGEVPAKNVKIIIEQGIYGTKPKASIISAEEMANIKNMNVDYDYSEGRVQNLLYGDSKGRWTPTYKSAQDSAEWMKSQFAFEEMTEPGLSHKSAKESAEAIIELKDKAMRERVAKFDTPEMKAKKAQIDLKAQLKAKHADKLK